MRMGMLLGTGVALLLAAGCSSSEQPAEQADGTDIVGESPLPDDIQGDQGESAAPFPEDNFSESDIVDHLGLEDDSGLLYYRDSGLECEVAVVLTSPAEVSTYADAGDVVATDPQQRVGVKLVGEPERECYDAVTGALADF